MEIVETFQPAHARNGEHGLTGIALLPPEVLSQVDGGQ